MVFTFLNRHFFLVQNVVYIFFIVCLIIFYLQELLRYKVAVEGACAEFEVLLQRFIRRASGIDDSHDSNKGLKRKSSPSRKTRSTKKQKVNSSRIDQDHAGAAPVPSPADADAHAAPEFDNEEEHVHLMTVPPSSPTEATANNVDDQQQELSDESDFMQLPKQARQQHPVIATSNKRSQVEDNCSKGSEQATNHREMPIKKPSGASDGFKTKDTDADNVSAGNAPIHAANLTGNSFSRTNSTLADLSNIYESGSGSVTVFEDEEVTEHPDQRTTQSAKSKPL